MGQFSVVTQLYMGQRKTGKWNMVQASKINIQISAETIGRNKTLR